VSGKHLQRRDEGKISLPCRGHDLACECEADTSRFWRICRQRQRERCTSFLNLDLDPESNTWQPWRRLEATHRCDYTSDASSTYTGEERFSLSGRLPFQQDCGSASAWMSHWESTMEWSRGRDTLQRTPITASLSGQLRSGSLTTKRA
jgi:hypothetical protein